MLEPFAELLFPVPCSLRQRQLRAMLTAGEVPPESVSTSTARSSPSVCTSKYASKLGEPASVCAAPVPTWPLVPPERRYGRSVQLVGEPLLLTKTRHFCR